MSTPLFSSRATSDAPLDDALSLLLLSLVERRLTFARALGGDCSRLTARSRKFVVVAVLVRFEVSIEACSLPRCVFGARGGRGGGD